MKVSQYQVVIVNLDPTIGKTRPCIVISPDEINHNLSTVVIAPLASSKRNYPSRMKVNIEGKVSALALDQIRTIDRQRIVKIGSVVTTKERLEIKALIKKIYVD